MKIKNFNELLEAKDDKEPKESKVSGEKAISILLGKLFQSRDLTHLYHLKTGSYAEHIALNGFYDAILLLLDQVIEEYQGSCGCKVDITIPETKISGDVVKYLEGLLKDVTEGRELFNSTSIQNVIDEIIGLISKTLYLLSLK